MHGSDAARITIGSRDECNSNAVAPPSLELPGRRRRKPKYAKVATTPSAGGFAIADDSSDSDGDMV